MSKNSGLIDLHTHSLLSDGALLPSELVRRYEVSGFKAVAITDHADYSNIDIIISGLTKVCGELNKYWKIKAIPGVELTHLPVEQFAELVRYARKKGAKIVVGHGESPNEPVTRGTNNSAIKAGVDILAHPGNILKEDARLAAERGVLLEITTRRGHSRTNSHVALTAKSVFADFVINSDCHTPQDIPSEELFNKTAEEAGLTKEDVRIAQSNSEKLVKRIIGLA